MLLSWVPVALLHSPKDKIPAVGIVIGIVDITRVLKTIQLSRYFVDYEKVVQLNYDVGFGHSDSVAFW